MPLSQSVSQSFITTIIIMGANDIPQIEYTPIEDLQDRVSKLKKTFNEHKTRSVEFRLVQLRKLYWA